MRALAASLALLLPLPALAGAQQYEPLAVSVQARLSSLVSDRAPASMNFKSSADAQRWLSEMDVRLERRIPDRKTRIEFLKTVYYEASRNGLDPQMVLGPGMDSEREAEGSRWPIAPPA